MPDSYQTIELNDGPTENSLCWPDSSRKSMLQVNAEDPSIWQFDPLLVLFEIEQGITIYIIFNFQAT